MKKRRASETNISEQSGSRSANHLVGIWKEKPNRIQTTPVLYTVTVNRGKFYVSGKDIECGTLLKISKIRWDGEYLHFETLYSPTKHKAKHMLKAISKDKMWHEISCTFSDGEIYADREIWIKEHSDRNDPPNSRHLRKRLASR